MKDRRGHSLDKHQFFKNPYQGLVIGEKILIVAHFKLALFQLWCHFLYFPNNFSYFGAMERTRFPDAELYAKSHQTLKRLGVTISNHVISFWFLSITNHVRATKKKQNRLIRSRKISCNWEKKFFFDYIKRKGF